MGVDLDDLEIAAGICGCEGLPEQADLIRDAIAELRELRARPTVPPWTRERPTVPGWYWTRDDFDRELDQRGEIKYLAIGTLDDDGNPVLWVDGGNDLDPEWEYAGPIPQPTIDGGPLQP